MHHSTLIGDITVLKSYGSEFEMSSTFFVDLLKIDCYIDLEYSAENKKIYDVKYFNQTVVRIEASLKTRDTRQRRRCQNFGQAFPAARSDREKENQSCVLDSTNNFAICEIWPKFTKFLSHRPKKLIQNTRYLVEYQ
ncbi:hypothetical protein GQX74_014917 [Glossina fuscipes]|nr:hypothetical protein GQX74_014917 [Glossina fuscipes]